MNIKTLLFFTNFLIYLIEIYGIIISYLSNLLKYSNVIGPKKKIINVSSFVISENEYQDIFFNNFLLI